MNLPLDLFIQEAACAIADVARKRKAAAIHAASNYTNALPALIAARKLGIPFSYEMRGLWNLTRASKVPDYERSREFPAADGSPRPLSPGIPTKSPVISGALGSIMEKMGVEQHRIHVLPNYVNPSTIEKARQSAGHKLKAFTVEYAGSRPI